MTKTALKEINQNMLYRNMVSRVPLLMFVLVTWTSAEASAQESESNIRSMFEERENDIKGILGTSGDINDDQLDRLRHAVNDMFDFASMGRAALGRHWADLSTEQQDNFVDVFSEIIRHQSLADVDVYRAPVTYDEVKVEGTSARVITTTTYKEVPTQVVYTLLLTGNAWLATDVILDEVSTVDGYSRSFQSYIRKKGFDALMISLNRKLERTRSES